MTKFILSKIETAASEYGKRKLIEDWKQNEKYRENIMKKCI